MKKLSVKKEVSGSAISPLPYQGSPSGEVKCVVIRREPVVAFAVFRIEPVCRRQGLEKRRFPSAILPVEEGERVIELTLAQGTEGGNRSRVVGGVGVGRIRRLGAAVVGIIPVLTHATDKELMHMVMVTRIRYAGWSRGLFLYAAAGMLSRRHHR